MNRNGCGQRAPATPPDLALTSGHRDGAEILNADRIFQAALRVARAMGLPKQRGLQAANAMARRITGIDLIREIESTAENEGPDLTPADMARKQRALLSWEGADAVLSYIDGRDKVTVDEIAKAVFPAGSAPSIRTRIGKLLRSLGWHGHRHRFEGGWTSTWRRPTGCTLPSGDSLVTVRYGGDSHHPTTGGAGR